MATAMGTRYILAFKLREWKENTVLEVPVSVHAVEVAGPLPPIIPFLSPGPEVTPPSSGELAAVVHSEKG